MGKSCHPKMFVGKRLRCLQCENVQTIYRRKCKNRSAGHIKHLYCVVCKSRVGHIELAI